MQYHKIETLFVRDTEGTKNLIEGQFRELAVEYLKDTSWIFTEKVDGTNIRVEWDGHKVTFGGRTENAQIPAYLLNETLVPKFSGTVNEQVFEQKFGEAPVTLYGEGFGGIIQKGGSLYRNKSEFVLFDVMVGHTFLERKDIEDIASTFSVDVVPVAFEGTIQEAVDYIKSKPKSIIAEQEREMEGIVGTPSVRLFDHRGKRIIVKIKVEDFAH